MNNIIRKIKHGFQFIFDNKYRFFILRDIGFFDNMPDELYLKKVFLYKLGYPLNLQNPQTFNEKLQWLKLHDRKPEYTIMVDKYKVKKYVADKIGEQYIISTLGVWDSFDEIDFDSLPNQFVLKCTHDSGGIVICRDKSKFDIKKAKKKINESLKRNFYYGGREWPYKHVKPRIIAEQYLENEGNSGLRDYKFYCFNGEPRYLYVSDGLEDHATAHITFLTMEWEKAPFQREDYHPHEVLPQKPKQFPKMVEIAKMLSMEHMFLRVDLYVVNNNIYLSELTFFPCNGMMPFVPFEWDEKMGSLIKLPMDNK